MTTAESKTKVWTPSRIVGCAVDFTAAIAPERPLRNAIRTRIEDTVRSARA